jgi:methionyl aminopeptidase
MSIQSAEELEALKRVGRVVALALGEMRRATRPGVTTAELDAVGLAVLEQHGARSAPQLVYKFPGVNCISLNDEAVHGIPGPRAVRDGDLVKLDVTAELDGYIADAAVTVALPGAGARERRLASCAESALGKAINAARLGRPVYEIGRAIDREVRSQGFHVLRELHGHGVGRTIHEPPSVPQWEDRTYSQPLTEGLVFTIEPIIAVGSSRVTLDPDGWTLRTADRSPSAHWEHTIVVTEGRPLILTAA